MNVARLENGVVINIEVVDQEWVDLQPDPSIFVPYTTDNPASIGFTYESDGYFYSPQPYPSWTKANGLWNPPVERPEGSYVWDEETLSWINVSSM